MNIKLNINPNTQYQSDLYDSGHDLYFMKYVGIVLAMVIVDVLTRWVLHKGISFPVSLDVIITLLVSLSACSLLLKRHFRYQTILFSEVTRFNLIITFVTSIFYGVFLIIYIQAIDPFYQNRCAQLLEGYDSGILGFLATQSDPLVIGGLGMLGILMAGSAWAPLLGLMLRRKSHPDDHYHRHHEYHHTHKHDTDTGRKHI